MSNVCTAVRRTPYIGLRGFLSLQRATPPSSFPIHTSPLSVLCRFHRNELPFLGCRPHPTPLPARWSSTQTTSRRPIGVGSSVASRQTPQIAHIKKSAGSKQAWWKQYDPEQGVPLPGGPLSQEQVTALLGSGVSAAAGNRALRVLHYRRVSGTLEDAGTSFPSDSGIPDTASPKALSYLRRTYPVDEEAAANAWAEEEAARLEKELEEDAELIHSYLPQVGKSKYGHSVLQEIRERNEQLYAEELKRKEAEAQDEQQTVGTLQPGGRAGELATREKSAWVKYYEERAMITKDPVAPQLGTLQRLWPSTLFALTLVGLCVVFAQQYIPPSRSARMWPDTPPAFATCAAIFVANAVVFVAWRIPPVWRLMNRLFVLVPGYPSAAAILGNVFSHQELRHFAMNMAILLILGPRLHEDVGRGNFLAIYLGSGVIGSLASFTFNVLRRNFVTSTLGASGAICGIVAALFLVNPSDSFTFIFWPELRIPISSQTFLASLIAVDIVAMFRRKTRTDHIAHLGGYATGIAAAYALRHQAAERKRIADEKKKRMGFMQQLKGSRS